jgi:hypothetical protein
MLCQRHHRLVVHPASAHLFRPFLMIQLLTASKTKEPGELASGA